jgi:hypothetical protein
VILRPADRGQARALAGEAGQDEKQGEFGGTGLAKRGAEAEDETGDGFGGGLVVEVAAEDALEGLDAGGEERLGTLATYMLAVD